MNARPLIFRYRSTVSRCNRGCFRHRVDPRDTRIGRAVDIYDALSNITAGAIGSVTNADGRYFDGE